MKKAIIFFIILVSITIQSQEIKFGKVTKQELEEKFYPSDSSANATYLFKKRRSYFQFTKESGFQIVTEIQERIKIYSKEALDRATVKVRLYKNSRDKEKISNIKGYTFNIENGQIIKEKLKGKNIFDKEKSKNWQEIKIAFPQVKEGSTIDLKYKIISPFYTSIDEVRYQFDIPVKNYITKIEIPEFFNFKTKFKGYYNITPVITDKSDNITFSTKTRTGGTFSRPVKTTFHNNKVSFIKKIYTYEATNVPALKSNEPFISNVKDYYGGEIFELSYIQFPNESPVFYTTTWKDVSKKIHQFKNFGGELKKVGYFKKDLQNILADKNNDLEKIAAIFNWVKTKVKWNGHYGKLTENGVRKAYKEGNGNVADINLMLTAILREAGLNANPVLISSRNNGIPLFPTMDGFNYVVSHVQLAEEKYIVLDATETYSTPNLLPVRALNWSGRKVTKNGASSWINISPAKHASEDHKIFAKITDDLEIQGMLKSTFGDLNAMNYRIKNNNEDDETLISKLEESYKIEIDNFKQTNKTAISKPIGRTIKFTSENLIEKINNKLYIYPLLFLAKTNNPFKSEERKFPVDFIAKWIDKHTTSIIVPSGYTVKKLPEPLAIGLPENLGVFKYQIIHKENKIQVQSILQFNKSLIGSHYYKILKDFYGKVVAKQSEKIVLVKS